MDTILGYLLYRSVTAIPPELANVTHLNALYLFFTWLLFIKTVKLWPHFYRHPQDIKFIPAQILFGYCHGFIKLYTLLTLNKVQSSWSAKMYILHWQVKIDNLGWKSIFNRTNSQQWRLITSRHRSRGSESHGLFQTSKLRCRIAKKASPDSLPHHRSDINMAWPALYLSWLNLPRYHLWSLDENDGL